jgi:hypothetical protein
MAFAMFVYMLAYLVPAAVGLSWATWRLRSSPYHVRPWEWWALAAPYVTWFVLSFVIPGKSLSNVVEIPLLGVLVLLLGVCFRWGAAARFHPKTVRVAFPVAAVVIAVLVSTLLPGLPE